MVIIIHIKDFGLVPHWIKTEKCYTNKIAKRIYDRLSQGTDAFHDKR